MTQVGLGLDPTAVAAGAAGLGPWLDRVAAAGLDHVVVGDHVSFRGAGSDGLLMATAVAMLQPRLDVHVGVYLLALRHPVPVARQLATAAGLAPGRLSLGIGVGGEDRHEIEICGIDPATRGRRTDESIAALRGLLTGCPTTLHGHEVSFTDAVVAPAPAHPIPMLVGGRSDAAVRRAGRLGDGWLPIWVSPERYRRGVADVVEIAESHDREAPTGHGLQVWCAFDETPEVARAVLAGAMEDFYGLPFERFERYSPTGSAERVAAFLEPYVEAGCTHVNLLARGLDAEAVLAGASEVRRLLAS
ncbi:LLM class flavin-dependent oxidoreductase [Acidimicrobiia bacterium EGI L10123]|uniref:LLM class flavin-dependent oxidoreductase n=1 Tax=Salinilacustrithrix flava TaxID=2957203 RepID=UPI003D7C313B|nr:LLM class flavin-dependent oxidoreductase [Acidimicrobiia bacterium EGI L10123]